MKSPFSIYSTWGLHDELGDHVELSEELARGALDTLRKWRDQHGIEQDFFHLDAFWFDPGLGFRAFKASHWPRGFEPLRDDIQAAGMKPGLWYSTTGYSLDVPQWKESRAESGHFGLADGPYAELLEADLFHAAQQWQVRLFKFDFADFYAAPSGVKRAPEETYALSVERFTGIVGRLRAAFPDIHTIAHVGYARNQQHQRQGWPHPVAVDPALLEALDAVFSGDPQPMDVPQTQLSRNIDLYQDRAVQKMLEAGIPIHRIEDHGTVMAATNTACYRGRSGFARSHIGQLARGGRRDLFYGDPALLTPRDLECLKTARSLFYDAWDRRLTTSFVGVGEVGTSPFHGYLTGGGSRGLLYIVNPTFQTQRIQLPLINLRSSRVLFHDGPQEPPQQCAPDVLTLELGAEQMALIGLGAYSSNTPFEAGFEPRTPRSTTLLPLSFHSTSDGLLAQVEELLPINARLLVVAQTSDAPPRAPNSLLPFLFGMQTTKKDETYEPETHHLVVITVQSGEARLEPSRRIPDVPIWSGMSWVAAIYDTSQCSVPLTIRVDQNLESPRRLSVAAYMLID